MKKTKVLIVDDSAIMRKFLSDIISSSPNFKVIGTSIDPIDALKDIKNLKPDVITLDIEMPRMDGLTFLSRLMVIYPMPVVMVSNFTADGSDEAIRAIQLGAIDFIQKPRYSEINTKDSLLNFTNKLLEKIYTASKTNINKRLVLRKYKTVKKKKPFNKVSNNIIAIGASAGGVKAISDILSELDDNLPGIVIVQHMLVGFTKAFADRVDKISKIHIKEAKGGEIIYNGTALIAPGNRHMLLKNSVRGFEVELNDDEPFGQHKPSVDILFSSIAKAAGSHACGVLLTGMGEDGAKGLLNMREKGAVTVAQDEQSSIVFGMPMKAIELGGAQMIKNIEQITKYLQGLGE